MTTKSRFGLLRSVVLVALGAVGTAPMGATCAAAESDVDWNCIPKLSDEPAAGAWKGDVVFDYTMSVPDSPAVFSIDFHGGIGLELKRDPDERLRRSSCPRGTVGAAPSFTAPPRAGCNIDDTPVQPLTRDDEKLPELTGTTAVTMQMHMGFAEEGFELTQNAASQRAANLSDTAEPDREGKRLEAVLLVGTPSQFQFGANATARDESGSMTGEGELNGGGTASARGTVQGDVSGTIDSNMADGQIHSHVDVTDRTGQRTTGDSSAAVPGINQQRRTLFRLVIEQRTCGEIKGRVESRELLDQVQSGGMVFAPVRSGWQATLDERDAALEDAAKRYADQPLLGVSPRDPDGTWANWQREWEFYSALRGPNPSDYVLCALKPAHEKIIRASMAALRALLDGPARGDAAVKLHMWRLMSVIEGFGRATYSECPVVREATEFLFGVKLVPPPR